MGRVAARLADHAILTSDNPRSEEPAAIIAQIREGFETATNFEIVEDRAQAIQRALEAAGPDDIVLIAGKGHENFQEFAHTRVAFDDRQVVKRFL
jgi:UDP-N-acetylmuramyl tripeptide synthase